MERRPSCAAWSCQPELSQGKRLQLQINGEAREVADELNLGELVSELAIAPERVAIEVNQKVVRRNLWTATTLADGDRIEIVHFVGGGEGSRQ